MSEPVANGLASALANWDEAIREERHSSLVAAAVLALCAINVRVPDEGVVAITVDGVDVYVRTDGDTTTVSVGTDETPAGRRVVVESWDGMSWEQEIKPAGS